MLTQATQAGVAEPIPDLELQLPEKESKFIAPSRVETLAEGELDVDKAQQLIDASDFTEEEQEQIDTIVSKARTSEETIKQEAADGAPQIAPPAERSYSVDLMVEEGYVDYDAGRGKIEVTNFMNKSRGREEAVMTTKERMDIYDNAFYNEPKVKRFIEDRRKRSGKPDYNPDNDPVVAAFYRSTNVEQTNKHGHTFVRIRSGDEDGQIDQYSFGFGIDTRPDTDGKLLSDLTNPDPAAKTATRADTKKVSYSSASKFMDFIRSYPTKVFGFYSENCTRFAVEALATAGMRVSGVGKLRFFGFGKGQGLKKLYSPTQISKAYDLYTRRANLFSDVLDPDREPMVKRLRSSLSITGLYKYMCINLQNRYPTEKGSEISTRVSTALSQLLDDDTISGQDLSTLFFCGIDGGFIREPSSTLARYELTTRRENIMNAISSWFDPTAAVRIENTRQRAQEQLDSIVLTQNSGKTSWPEQTPVSVIENISRLTAGDINIVKYLYGFNPQKPEFNAATTKNLHNDVMDLNQPLKIFAYNELYSSDFYEPNYASKAIDVVAACARALCSDAHGVVHWPRTSYALKHHLFKALYKLGPDVLTELQNGLRPLAPKASE